MRCFLEKGRHALMAGLLAALALPVFAQSQRKVEDTLATCLGGRSAGFDFYELMPRGQ